MEKQSLQYNNAMRISVKMIKILIISLVLLFAACKKVEPPPLPQDDVILYNVVYELTYNPIYEAGDRWSYIIFSIDNTFSMSVNSCDGVDAIKGTFFIEGDDLFIYPENYYCDVSDNNQECDERGYRFVIISQKELVIMIGVRCIAEESVFTTP